MVYLGFAVVELGWGLDGDGVEGGIFLGVDDGGCWLSACGIDVSSGYLLSINR